MRKAVVRDVREQFSPASAVLSLYGDTDRSRRSPKEIVIALKNLYREALRLVETWPREDQESVRILLERIFPRVEDLSTDLPKGWVFFVSPRSQTFSLPLPGPVVPSACLGREPQLFPLVQVLSPFRETLVLLVESRTVAFLRRFGAELELIHRRDVDFPSRVKSGGRQGMEERRIERHAEEETGRILRDVAVQARALFKGGTFRRALVAGPRELALPLTDLLREQLPTEELDLLPETPERGEAALRALLDQWAQTRFWQEGEALVDRVVTEAPKGGPAAAGWRAVLAASGRGAVHQLLLEERELRRGVRCPACGALGLDEETCPLCGGGTVEEPDLMEALIGQVYDKDGEVLVLGRPSPLREWEGLGALLRFSL